MAVVVDRSNFGILLEPRLRKVFFETYAEKPQEFPKIFNVLTSKKAKESDYHVAGMGLWEEKDPQGSTSYDSINPGVEINYVHKSYSKGFMVTEEMYEDEMYDVIDKMPKNVARTGRVTVEQIAASILNNGFSNTGYDGKAIFADNHPLYGEGVTAVGDNLTDAALNDKGLKAGILLAQSQVDDAGLKIETKPTHLVIPTALEFQALTILNSIQVAGGNLNDKNVLPNLTPVVLSYLTDPLAWFLMDKDINEFNFFWRKKPTFKSEKNFDTDVAKYKGKLRFSCGYSAWRGWVGSTGVTTL